MSWMALISHQCAGYVSPSVNAWGLPLLGHCKAIYLSIEACVPLLRIEGRPSNIMDLGVMHPDPFSLFYGNNIGYQPIPFWYHSPLRPLRPSLRIHIRRRSPSSSTIGGTDPLRTMRTSIEPQSAFDVLISTREKEILLGDVETFISVIK